MEPLAYGYLRLTNAEFEQMTPIELQWRYDAEVGREDREWDRLAQLACWVINPWMGGNGITPRQLLRRGVQVSDDWWDKD